MNKFILKKVTHHLKKNLICLSNSNQPLPLQPHNRETISLTFPFFVLPLPPVWKPRIKELSVISMLIQHWRGENIKRVTCTFSMEKSIREDLKGGLVSDSKFWLETRKRWQRIWGSGAAGMGGVPSSLHLPDRCPGQLATASLDLQALGLEVRCSV